MAKFNPDFWEVTVSQESWRQFSAEDGLHHQEPADIRERHQRRERAKALWPELRSVIDELLTPRQREVIGLYFFEGLNQREIAAHLGIAQQSVSEHLYGKVRNGRAVGGAIRKLRKACAKQDVRWG